MGFLDFLRKPQAKEYSLEEAMGIIEKEVASIKSKNLEKLYQDALKVTWEIRQLAQLIEEFSGKPANELGRSSEGVKERFCALSQKQLASLSAPEKENPYEFLRAARLVVGNLGGLTQRQVVHINFFFKEDFRHVGKKINEINLLLTQEGGETEQERALSLYGKLAQLEEQKRSSEQSIVTGREKLGELEDRRHTLPELAAPPDTQGLDAAEAQLSAIKQEIDSFLAIQKTLKKYAYVAESKDHLLNAYIESPSNALLQDSDLKIADFAKAASEFAGEGKIESDKKLAVIADSLGYLKSKRAELMHAAEEAVTEREKYAAAAEVFEASIKDRTNRMAEIEGELKEVEKSIRSEKDAVQRIGREITDARAELLMLASKILGDAVIRA